MSTVNDISELLSAATALSLEKEKQVKTAMGGMAVPFIANQGQVHQKVAFYANTFGGTVFVTKNGEIVYSLPNNAATENNTKPAFILKEGLKKKTDNHKKTEITGVALRERFSGATITQIKSAPGRVGTVNYFIGSNKDKWKRNIPSHETISFGDIYDSIELRLRAYSENVEKLFHVRPGGDHKKIQVVMEGMQSMRVMAGGELELQTELGAVRFTAPVAYQETGDERKYIDVAYQVKGNSYGFTVGKYDHNRELVIDPLLASTFFGSTNAGGGGDEQTPAIALTDSGAVYITGETTSNGFPIISGAYDAIPNSPGIISDIFISRLSADLSTLEASTFLGGTGRESWPDIAIDTSGDIIIVGTTGSIDFPVTTGAYDTSHNGKTDVFVFRLSADLSSLTASTFLGGSDDDNMPSIGINASGRIYIAGTTHSTDFPATSGAYSETLNGSNYYDVFISRLSADLSSLEASTFIGGTSSEFNSAIAIDVSGEILVSGRTYSSDFPTTSGAFDTTHNDKQDIYISRLPADLTSLAASTLLGGADDELNPDIAIDSSGDLIISGQTKSVNFPTTIGVYDPSHNGNIDIFISRLPADLSSLTASTFLGGMSYDQSPSIRIDPCGRIYIGGITMSDDFPTTVNGYDPTHNYYFYDIFLARMSADLSNLEASTYLGGTGSDFHATIEVAPCGWVYVCGATNSPGDFPVTSDAYDPTYNGEIDIIVSRLSPDLSCLDASTFLGGSPADDSVSVAVDGNNKVYVTGLTNSSDFPTTLGAYDTTTDMPLSRDVFVSRLSADLQSLEASTFLGGNNNEDVPTIGIGPFGNIFISGMASTGFPSTDGAYDTTYNGGWDIFVSRLSPDLNDLTASTFLGGTGSEYSPSIGINAAGEIYVSGDTHSVDFPSTGEAYSPMFNGVWDVFVAKLSNDLSSLTAATYIGGSGSENDPVLAVGANGDVYVAGDTMSNDFPVTDNAYAPTWSWGAIFISRLSADLSSLTASTYFGHKIDRNSASIAISPSGEVFVSGLTFSSDFPTTAGAYDTTHNGSDIIIEWSDDLFISKLSADLSSLIASTFLGGSSDEMSPAIKIDTSGRIYVSGETTSNDFPTSAGNYDQTYNGNIDIFVSRLSADLSRLDASTYLGGSADDYFQGMALGLTDEVVLVGRTLSINFPTTISAFERNNSKADSLFVSKFAFSLDDSDFPWHLFIPAILSSQPGTGK